VLARSRAEPPYSRVAAFAAVGVFAGTLPLPTQQSSWI